MKRDTQEQFRLNIQALLINNIFPSRIRHLIFNIFILNLFLFSFKKISFILLSPNISQPQLPFPLLFPASPLVSKFQPPPLHLHPEKIRPLGNRKHQPNMTNDTIRPSTIPHVKALRGKPGTGKRSQEQTKESETSPTVRSPLSREADNHNIHAEELHQTHSGSRLTTVSCTSPAW